MLQNAINETAYPPTHQYDVATMEPSWPLSERLEKILAVCPTLFEGDSFLDVGANKGFFSLLAAENCDRVVAVENDTGCTNILRGLPANNISVMAMPFGDVPTKDKFDRVFIGNAHHYLYRDAGGWEWVIRLAKLSTDLVVIEGPTGMECTDMAAAIPATLQEGFNRERFMHYMYNHFELVGMVPTSSYTPDRYIMVFKRMDDLILADMRTYGNYLKYIYTFMAKYCKPTDTIIELCCRHDRGVISQAVMPHEKFIRADKDPTRGNVVDILQRPLPECDIAISTAIFHHCREQQWETVMCNLCKNTKRMVMISGPNRHVMTELIGDHKSHLDMVTLSNIAESCGFETVSAERVGLSMPFCEVLMVFKRA